MKIKFKVPFTNKTLLIGKESDEFLASLSNKLAKYFVIPEKKMYKVISDYKRYWDKHHPESN